nr:hypothetical protein [Bradyrhizobium hereditatis]
MRRLDIESSYTGAETKVNALLYEGIVGTLHQPTRPLFAEQKFLRERRPIVRQFVFVADEQDISLAIKAT